MRNDITFFRNIHTSTTSQAFELFSQSNAQLNTKCLCLCRVIEENKQIESIIARRKLYQPKKIGHLQTTKRKTTRKKTNKTSLNVSPFYFKLNRRIDEIGWWNETNLIGITYTNGRIFIFAIFTIIYAITNRGTIQTLITFIITCKFTLITRLDIFR